MWSSKLERMMTAISSEYRSNTTSNTSSTTGTIVLSTCSKVPSKPARKCRKSSKITKFLPTSRTIFWSTLEKVADPPIDGYFIMIKVANGAIKIWLYRPHWPSCHVCMEHIPDRTQKVGSFPLKTPQIHREGEGFSGKKLWGRSNSLFHINNSKNNRVWRKGKTRNYWICSEAWGNSVCTGRVVACCDKPWWYNGCDSECDDAHKLWRSLEEYPLWKA